MILERINNEILVRLPISTDLSELQNILDFIRYKELASSSKSTQNDADILSEEINKSIWEKFQIKDIKKK